MTLGTGLGTVSLSVFLDGLFWVNTAATGLTRALLVGDWHGFDESMPKI